MGNEEIKKEKPVKAPGIFKKPVKKITFEKRFVNKIEHPQDRNFFISCFEEHDDNYIMRGSLSRDDVKKLKGIIKVIKANRKFAVNFIPLVFAAIIITVIVIFFMIFANPLFERAMEKGLEAVFEAKSDVDNFRLSLIRFNISTSGITVANRDSPMTNLFQTGRTEIRLKPEAVLRGKVYIEEIRADAIRFGTERTVSGDLGIPPKVKPEKQKREGPPLVDLKNFDAMALLNQEYGKLSTPKLYDDAINAYNETSEKWKKEVENTGAKIQELRASSQPVLNINVSSIRDIETVRETVQDINNLITSVQNTVNDMTNIVGGLESDINRVLQLETNARNAFTSDLDHLKSYVNLGSGSAFSALEPFIRDVLSDSARRYLDYGIRALEALEKIKILSASLPKSEKEQKPKKQPKVVFRGRDVIFPVVSYPAFYMGVLVSDFTIDAFKWSFDMRNISSDPDLTGKPATLSLGFDETGGSLKRKVDFNGMADFRTNPRERFSADVKASGFPVNLSGELNGVGINGFTGETAFSLLASGGTDGGFSGGGDMHITKAMLIDPRGTLAEAADTAVRQADNISMGIKYTHYTNQNDDFNITTNIGELIAQAIRRTAEAYAQQALSDIERALRQKIDQYIDGRFVSKDDVDNLLKIARGDKTAMDQMSGALNNKRTEFEQRIKDEASRQTEQALQNVIQGNTPSIQTPSLPGLPRR